VSVFNRLKRSAGVAGRSRTVGLAALAVTTASVALAAGSPAPGIGFVSFDATAAGRTSVALVPATVPAGFPLQEPADPATFY